MITEAFSPIFHSLTPNKDLNFVGAVIRYFDKFTHGVSDETKNTYIRDYNNRVFPVINPGKPVSEYDEQYINELLSLIQKTNSYDDMTISSRYHHLLMDPCEEYYKDESHRNDDNPLWGAGYKFGKSSTDDSIDSALMRIPKSLSLSQEHKAEDILLDPKTEDGLLPGLATMLCTGVRNNEAAGLNFGDIVELLNHAGYYILRVTRSSVRDSNRRKAGGKTSNAPRRLPLIKRYTDYICERKAYLCSKITFPYTDKNNNTFYSVNDLPIACRGNNYTIPCSASDLTRAGKSFLRDKLKMKENQISGISYVIQHPEYDSLEKDPTTYLLRRNFGTHLYNLGFRSEWREYYMGHLIENDNFKRSDFNDEEFLFEMALRLEKHPLNPRIESTTNTIIIPSSKSSHYHITIQNKELDDPISLIIKSPKSSAEMTFAKSHKELPSEIDITNYQSEDSDKSHI